MKIEASVLHRLRAARHLIESSGQELTAISDPLVVAQKAVLAHDAAELVFLAITSQLGVKAVEKNGKLLSDPSFIALASAVMGQFPKQMGAKLKLLEDLNRVRVAFKHHGSLPDAATNYHLFADTVSLLDNLCEALLGESLLSVDHIAAIDSDDIKERLSAARQEIYKGDFKEALEEVARGLAIAFSQMNVPSSLHAGRPSSEEALLLSGRGIDPVSFLTMQQLLPVSHFGGDAEWVLRKYGHPANWTFENALFCLETAATVIVRLQSAPVRPRPYEFYDVFEDVLEIMADQPEAYLIRSSMLGFSGDEMPFNDLLAGDKISGIAVGHLEHPRPHMGGFLSSVNYEIPFESAVWIEVRDPRSARLPAQRGPFEGLALWLRKDLVTISYGPSEIRRAWQRASQDESSEVVS